MDDETNGRGNTWCKMAMRGTSLKLETETPFSDTAMHILHRSC